MNNFQLRIVGSAVLFLLVFIFGFWLSRSGKPYNQVIFTIHKLTTLGAVILLAMTISQAHQATPLNLLQISVIGITAMFFVGAILTGALLSVDKTMPFIVLRLHQITPYLALLATCATLYLILALQSEMVKP
jgi:hypothetical protein